MNASSVIIVKISIYQEIRCNKEFLIYFFAPLLNLVMSLRCSFTRILFYRKDFRICKFLNLLLHGKLFSEFFVADRYLTILKCKDMIHLYAIIWEMAHSLKLACRVLISILCFRQENFV